LKSGNSTRIRGEGSPPDSQAHRAQPRTAVQAADQPQAIRAAIDAGKKDEAKKALSQTFSVIDKMSGKGIIHDNAAGRYKSRLVKRIAAR
jgi:small subunit ribosomal protein S20